MKESTLNFESFTHHQALMMALKALDIVKERQYRRIGIRISLDQKLIFQYLMDGKNEDVYLKGKEKVVLESQHSSDYVFHHQADYPEFLTSAEYCVSSGAIPIFIQGICRGSISISGMTQEMDHALAYEVLSTVEGAQIT